MFMPCSSAAYQTEKQHGRALYMCRDWLRQKALRSFWHKASKEKPRRLDFVQQVDAPGFWQSLEFIHRQHRKLQVPLRLHKTCMIHDCTCVEQVCTSLQNV